MAITSLAGIVRTHGTERPEQAALHVDGRTITQAELLDRSSRVANGLRSLGIKSQDRIGFIDKNGPEFFEVLYGGAMLNAVNVGVNWRLAPTEMAYILDHAEAKVLFVGPEFIAHIEKIESELGSVTTIIALAGDHPRYLDYEQWVATQPPEDPGVESGLGDIAMQLYTSGTTGLPKGVMLSNDNFFGGLGPVLDVWRFTPESVTLMAMPFFHIGGSGWGVAAMVNGGSGVIVREVDPTAIVGLIGQHQVTNAFLVPAVIQFLQLVPDVDKADFSSLQTLVYGASPITDKVLVAAMELLGCDFYQCYGLTETTGAITHLLPEDHDPIGRPALLRSCGKPAAWVEIRMVDPDTGTDVPVGEVGELWTRSRQNMVGYWKQPEATAATIDADGWLRTGDAGYFDSDGYVYLHDRVKDMIVSGGENIYPAEVENALMKHPGVADVAVIGVPSEKWGETVKAIVVRAADTELTDAELITFSREWLAGYKCPTSVDFTDVLPRNPSGKLLKRELREPYWEGHTRRVN
jgi:long-chain acyl-CoA synthetase